MNYESSQSAFSIEGNEHIVTGFGYNVSFMESSIYRPWDNDNQDCPRAIIEATNKKAKESFQNEALLEAIDLAANIRKLDKLKQGTKLRILLKDIDAVLQIKGNGGNKKIRLLFTNKGTWKVGCFCEIKIRLLELKVYPSWLNREQLILYRKLRWLYNHPASNY